MAGQLYHGHMIDEQHDLRRRVRYDLHMERWNVA